MIIKLYPAQANAFSIAFKIARSSPPESFQNIEMCWKVSAAYVVEKQAQPSNAQRKQLSDIGEISNTCLCTLEYDAHQVLKLDILWFSSYNDGHKCPAGHSRVQKWTMHYNA